MLLERKVFNRYARYHEIRYEDSFEIIHSFINGIKSRDQVNQTSNVSTQMRSRRAVVHGYGQVYKPIFC
jgi:hypothetical protein